MEYKELPKARSVKLNFIMNAILKMSAFIFPLITFPYVSRVLGVAGNGKIAFAGSVVSYFTMFAQLGIPTYGIRACAQCRNNPRELNKIVQELLILNSVTVVISYVALAICLMTVPRLMADRLLIAVTSLSILLGAVGMEWLFQALEQYSYITIRNLSLKVVSIILMFMLVHKPEHYFVYGMISVVGTCGSNIFNFIYASRFLEHKPIGNYEFKRHIRPILNFFLLSVSVSVYTSMDSLMLGFLSTDMQVGFYAAAIKMKSIVVCTITALGGVLLPRMSNLLAEGKKDEFNSMIRKSFNFIFIVSISVTIYFIGMSKPVIDLLAGAEYYPAVLPMQIISLTIIFIGLSNITGMQILVPTGREKLTTLSTVYGAITNLIVNAVAIPRLGAVGAAIGTVAAEGVVLFAQIIYIRKELKPMLQGIQYLKIILANCVSTMSILVFGYFVVIDLPFLRLLINAILYFGVFGAILILTKESFVQQYFEQIICKLIRKRRK